MGSVNVNSICRYQWEVAPNASESSLPHPRFLLTLRERSGTRSASLTGTVPQGSYATYISRDVTPPSPASIASLPGVPVFVLNTGTILSVRGYGYQDSRITYSLIGGGSGVISTDEVDWTTTTRINAQRGVRVTLRSGRNIPDASEF